MEIEEALKIIESQKSDAEKTKVELDSILAKNKTLLDETKKAKAEAKAEAEALAKAEAEKHAKEGNFEELLKSSEEARKLSEDKLKEADDKLNALALQNEKALHLNKVNAYGMKFNPLSDNAMSDLIPRLSERTKMFEGELKVLDKEGELTISSLDDLKSELIASGEISHLIKGSQASGSGATGGSKDPDTPNMSSTEKISAGLKEL